LAKQAATLDVLSDGRLDLGLGAGWQEEEFTSSSISYEGRFDLLDDTAAACRALWQEGPVALSTPSFSFDELWCHPLPVQAGGPPLWFGGPATGRNARRIATYGVGWLPVSNLSPADLAAAVAGLRQVFADAGRDPAELKVRAGLPLVRDDEKRPLLGPTLAQADQFLEAGATEVIVGLGAFVRSAEDLDEALGAIGQA
jgi:alkanesulfonate monooxygenase SsuD/methylene tetrahydromethanopterin reductase-like flavin-dependent oxidoreductase (luciferase family)